MFFYNSDKGFNDYFNDNLFNTHIDKMKKDARNQSVNHKTRLTDLDNIEASGDTTNFDYF